MNDYTIRLEEKKDYREVENLVRESFWTLCPCRAVREGLNAV